uniref:Uncharacterized protein n=1 Tax=Meloidogyne enterolobii TaxID=390850 RepID=A0A6V7Y7D9_MELEN|nr:unnamed protein product [Meloidogyne enterolobii]
MERPILSFERIILELVDRLKELENKDIPKKLGDKATPNQLRRQYFFVKNTLEQFGDLIYEIDDNKKKATEYIGRLSAASKEIKEASFSTFLEELDLASVLKEVRKTRANWETLKYSIEERLDIDPEEASIGSSNHGGTSIKAKLPQIQIQKFDGEIESWFSFWENFKVLVHDERNLSEIEKFNFLQAGLEGAAKELIEGIPITKDGYYDAIDLILEKFGDSKKLIRSLNQEIMNLPISECLKKMRDYI